MPVLMPKATAVWLIENTALTFVQIGEFVGLHELEIGALADGDSVATVQAESPLQSGMLTQDEIDRCSADTSASLRMNLSYTPPSAAPKGGRRYIPMLKRANKPNAIAWLVREYPEMTDAQISKLVGSTKPTIQAIRHRNYWNMANIEAGSPVELGLCTMLDLQAQVDIALARRTEKQQAEQLEKPLDTNL